MNNYCCIQFISYQLTDGWTDIQGSGAKNKTLENSICCRFMYLMLVITGPTARSDYLPTSSTHGRPYLPRLHDTSQGPGDLGLVSEVK